MPGTPTQASDRRTLLTCFGRGLLALRLILLPAASAQARDAYVADFNSNEVSAIDTATNTFVATIPAGNGPIGIAITPDGATAYVADFNSNVVTPIHTATNTAETAIPVGSAPVRVAVSAPMGLPPTSPTSARTSA